MGPGRVRADRKAGSVSAGELSPAMRRAMRRLVTGAVEGREIGGSTARALWARRLVAPLRWKGEPAERYALTRAGVERARSMGLMRSPAVVAARQLTFGWRGLRWAA